jgi:hypothetical protein
MNPRGVNVNAASCAVSHAEATIIAEYETVILPFFPPSTSYLSTSRIPQIDRSGVCTRKG